MREIHPEIQTNSEFKANHKEKKENPPDSSIPNNKQEGTLEIEQVAKVHAWSREWLSDNYNSSGGDSKSRKFFLPDELVIGELAELTETREDVLERRLPPQFREGADIFLNTLVDFCKEKSIIPQEREKLENFIERIQQSLFSYSPNISNYIGLDKMFILTAKANRIPEVQGFFGQSIVGEMMYELSFCDEKSIEAINKKIDTLDISTLLDVIQQSQTIAADGIANGEWADKSVERIESILKRIKSNHRSPIIEYAVDLALERISKEELNPSLGVVTWHGRREAGRLHEDLSRDLEAKHYKLSEQVDPDIDIAQGNILTPIASDAIAVLDHSHLPRYFGSTTIEQLPEPAGFSFLALRNANKAVKQLSIEKIHYKEDMMEIVKFINQRIVKPISNKEDQSQADKESFSTLGQRWNTISTLLDASDWDLFFRVYATRSPYLPTELADEFPKFKDDLENFLEKTEREFKPKLKPVHFEAYEQISNNVYLNPFHRGKEKDFSLLLQHLHRPELREKVENDLRISFADIPLRSQIHLLRFLAEEERGGFDRMQAILQKRPELSTRILKSFLACAEDVSFARAILFIAEQSDSEITQEILNKYSEIVDASEDVREYVQSHFRGLDMPEERVTALNRQMLHKSNELLLHYSTELERSKDGKFDESGLIEKLQHTRAELMLFASALRETSKDQKISLEDIQGTELFIQDSVALSEQDQKEMEVVFKNNRPEYPPDLFEQVKKDFKKVLSEPDHEFRLLKHGGHIVAFLRFDKIEPGRYAAGSFNLRSEARGTQIGIAMAKKAVEEVGRDNIIEAEVYEKNPAKDFYTRFLGFKKVGEIPNYKGTGVNFWKLERPRQA